MAALGISQGGTGQVTVLGARAALGFYSTAPATKTANFTVEVTDDFFICNKAGTTVVTLPSAALYTGRVLTFKSVQDAVSSVSSNVVLLAGGAAQTDILAGSGNWAILVSDGTNWITMVSN